MSKRGSNIYRRKDGRYEGRIPIGYLENGRIRYKSVYAKTLTEVKEKMAQFYSIRNEQNVPDYKITFSQIAEQWLVSAKLRMKPSSYANYKNLVNKHLVTTFGCIRMSDLSSAKMNDFILNKMQTGKLREKGGLSAKSVRDIMTVFRSISMYAEREYGIRSVHFTMPKTEQKKMEVLNADERRRLEQYLISVPNLTHASILLCMFTGLRVGELCGLQWRDINIKSCTISVNRTIQRVNHNGHSEVVIGTPKSRSSVRTIPMPQFMAEYLEKYKSEDEVYLVTGKRKPTEPRTMQNRFHAILKEAGVREVNFHMLRHTYATVCVEHVFDAKTLSELLGHADASIALNRYVHSSMKLKHDYVSRLQLST